MKELQKANALLTAISNAQRHFMLDAGTGQLFQDLLADFLALSGSGYGFIGEVLRGADGQPFLKTHAYSDIAWYEYMQHQQQTRHKDSLLAEVLHSAETLISNRPADDFHNIGLPDAYPPLNTFLGMPVMSDDKMVGMIVLANRDNGYDQAIVDYLKPLSETYGLLIELMRSNIEGQESQLSIKAEGKSLRLRQALDQVYDNVFIFDPETLLFTYANQAAIRQLGYSTAEFYRIGPVDIKPFYDEDQFKQAIKPLLDGEKESLTFTTVHRNKAGTDFPVEIVLQYVLSDAQRPHFVAIVRDMTDRIASQKALRDSDERLRHSQIFANIGTWDWNIKTGELYWSERIGPLFGYQEGELETTYENFLAAVHPDDRQAVVDAIAACVERGEEYNIEHRCLWPDGSEHWMLERGDVVRDEQGEPLRMLGMVQDVTEMKKAEIELMAAKEEAERASKAKTEFLSSMSHELRTPLNAIMGFAQLFSYDVSANAEQKTTANEIYQAGLHLRNLIDDVLDLNKIESGGIELSLEPVNVFAALNECRNLVMPMVEKHGISLAIDKTSCSNNIYVQADRTRFKQVFLNLLSNAVKYNRENGSVTVVCEQQQTGVLRIKVTDTGVGILNKDLDYLFKPFTRLVNETSEIEGSGIGLNISKQFVEHMQGEIGVDSQLGKGSCFWVDMKLVETMIQPAIETQNDISRPRSDSAGLESLKILVVEDNPTNRTVFKHQFQALGYAPEIVSGPEKILSQLQEMPYELILTDIQMPGMGGYDLVRHIRELEKGSDRHVPVVAVTANVMSGEREHCIEAGMDDYISKPVDIKVLKKVVRHWLGHSERSADLGYEVAAPIAVSGDDLNLERLAALVGGNVEQQRQIVNNFFETLPGTLREIHASWDEQDIDRLAFWAHRFKSSSAAVGADALAQMCQAIEDFSREGDRDMLVNFLGELESQVQRAVVALRNALKQLERRKSDVSVQKMTHAIGRVLVVDDDPVILHALVASLSGLDVKHVFAASSGNEALTILDGNSEAMDIVFCDLNMPVMDGVEFLRHLVKRDYQGAIVLLSGEDSRILNSARNLANAHSFRFVAAMEKPVIQAQLATMLEKVTNKKDVVARPPDSEFSLRELRQAIESDEFVVYYQPKIDTFNKSLLGVEALVRWQHPDKGFIMPDLFIPMAEESGLIDALTELVFEKTFSQLKKWRQQGLGFKVSINIAAGTIGRRLNFPEQVMDHLDNYGLSPDDVILEITESGIIDDLATTLDTLVRLRLKGVTLSIDDFGTGYSTFKQLQGIPFTELKIDKEFVMNGVSDPSSRAIVESSILLGQKLGMTLVAEGVESKDDWDLLRKLGCHMLQGFFISRPVPADQLEKWLEQWQAGIN